MLRDVDPNINTTMEVLWPDWDVLKDLTDGKKPPKHTRNILQHGPSGASPGRIPDIYLDLPS